jgi:hypothetical protein
MTVLPACWHVSHLISLPKPVAFELFHATMSHVSELLAKTSPVSYQPAYLEEHSGEL